MASHALAPFPAELLAAKKQIREQARAYGLDFFPVVYEMCDYEQMNQIAAYGGFPQRYPHWRFGMEYERLRKQHHYGLGRIYEMVINNDPCYAYLQESNALVGHLESRSPSCEAERARLSENSRPDTMRGTRKTEGNDDEVFCASRAARRP